VHSLRTRLIVALVVATVLPIAATIWITTSLIDRSLGYATTGHLDRLSHTLEATVRELYQREREALRQDVLSGRAQATTYSLPAAARWPEPVRAFWESGEQERFGLSGDGSDHVEYLRRDPDGVRRYQRDLRGIRMDDLSAEIRQSRGLVTTFEGRDLRRGFTLTLLLVLTVVWCLSLASLVIVAHRVTRPIQQLTAALTAFAGGDWSRRLQRGRDDEVGRAVDAFNHMAEQLQQNRDRLVHLTRMASWQSLARKTAHELKNSLTPIRLTVEEMLARQPPTADRRFVEQAAQIVVSEIDTLERRVHAFSEFGGEPALRPESLDLNALVEERVALVARAHPGTAFDLRLDDRRPHAHADADITKGILMNLLQNAAEAAGSSGSVLALTRIDGPQVAFEVHDSGPGLSEQASATLFEPSITFKKRGMGLGLSIARRNALLSNGDISLTAGELGGAAFRVVLPHASH
jgi:two-component system nitrogen regulation sensor histidine kinase NtrY